MYLPAIAGYVPPQMVQAIAAFLDACYIARRADLDEDSLQIFENSVANFHQLREIFRATGVRPKGFSLPRQHSLVHYAELAREFGAPGGICSSITESRHITAVKRPWRRSNRYEALGQMLMTNQRLDKLAAARVDYVRRRMMVASHNAPITVKLPGADDDDEGPTDELVTGNVVLARTRGMSHFMSCISASDVLTPVLARKYPRSIEAMADHLGEVNFVDLTCRFLYDQLHPNALRSSQDVEADECPVISSKISVFHSAVATFYAPSDESGIRGMKRERIRCTPNWRNQGPRRDCALVVENEDKPGMKGMSAVRVLLLFSFEHEGVVYPCALVEWFKTYGAHPDKETGMWRVRPQYVGAGQHAARLVTVVHLKSFLRGVHLLPCFGNRPLPYPFSYTYSLDVFEAFYVNRYADHRAHELIF